MKRLKLRRGCLDLLAACPPCQGFSTMRTKNGTRRNRDRRNDLIFDVLRMIRSMKPVSVMLENVAGVARSRRFLAFRKALGSLGYSVTWDILNTVDFGVPQQRRRLVLLASRVCRPSFASRNTNYRTVRKAIGALCAPRLSGDPLHNYRVRRTKRIADLIKRIPCNGGSRKSLGTQAQLACHQRSDGFWDVYGRMGWDKPAPTITGGCTNPSKGRFIHPTANRAITLREAALLQTFPKRYRFSLEQGRDPTALLIGNALPPEFIRRHATALKRAVLASGSNRTVQ